MQAMWLILQQDNADDYVVATGKTHSVRELCKFAFSHMGLNYLDYIREDAESYRPTERFHLVGDAGKAHKNLGWYPKVGFKELIEMMVDADMKLLIQMNNIND
jgi:GDPmannose 4,6-dehydratase